MKTLESMTVAEAKEYMQMLAEATRTIVPPDGQFAIAVIAPGNKCHWVSTIKRRNVPAMLRDLADNIEAETTNLN